MAHPIHPLDGSEKFAFTGEHVRDSGWRVTASGRGIEIGGIMWPLSQVRVGAVTQYGEELFAAKWLLRQRGAEAEATRSRAFTALVTMKAENRRV